MMVMQHLAYIVLPPYSQDICDVFMKIPTLVSMWVVRLILPMPYCVNFNENTPPPPHTVNITSGANNIIGAEKIQLD